MSNVHMLRRDLTLFHGDMRDVLRVLPDNFVDAVVTDPPYHLTSVVQRFGADDAAPARSNGPTGVYARSSAGFMGKKWDGGDIAFQVDTWREIFRVLKPGGHLLAMGGTRTYHRLACAIEDAGFEVRDMALWMYGTGFPKSLDVSKAIDKAAGAKGTLGEPRSVAHAAMLAAGTARRGQKHDGWNRPWMDDPEAIDAAQRKYISATPEAAQWQGWGTALKPAIEPTCLARKPLSEATVAANVLRWGTGALNIDGCRVPAPDGITSGGKPTGTNNPCFMSKAQDPRNERSSGHVAGRWPANVIHDGSAEVIEAFPQSAGQQGDVRGTEPSECHSGVYSGPRNRQAFSKRNDSGSAARFFFNTAKSDTQWLARNLQGVNVQNAEQSFSLDAKQVGIVLKNAATQSMLRLEPTSIDCQGHFTNVTPSELRLISENVIEMILSLDEKLSFERLPVKLTRSDSLADVAVTQKQIDIITITIARLKLNGCAEHVTFNTTRRNWEHGEKGCGNRFHYSAKASKSERAGSRHPTVKPIALMAYFIRLVTPPGGIVLDPFAGTGTTGVAALQEGKRCLLIEREDEYAADIQRRFTVDNP